MIQPWYATNFWNVVKFNAVSVDLGVVFEALLTADTTIRFGHLQCSTKGIRISFTENFSSVGLVVPVPKWWKKERTTTNEKKIQNMRTD